MPDSTKNFSVDSVNAPVGNTTVTRTEFIDALEHLNYASGNMRSIDELSGTAGFVQLDGSGAATIKRFLASTGLGWTNFDGEGGNPTVRLTDPVTFLHSLLSVETNAITNNYVVSILNTGLSYALPTPTIGVAGVKVVLNKHDYNSNIAITSNAWVDYPFDSSFNLSSGNFAIFFHDTNSKWYVPAAEDSTLT